MLAEILGEDMFRAAARQKKIEKGKKHIFLHLGRDERERFLPLDVTYKTLLPESTFT